ncbi:hypothetical protein [Janthinobacterium fluminis]|uniref:Uncharacterized protein n=1 Tax=Janthinobacterium fluminis TaxID=2987524 RepID=A0ABT5K4H0_9BURK|nr:hypothetical protein [Janthinobacterium fluminis]MDC8759872.1 hypothetical protein [Janthinobacterium fluminis]
MSAHPSSLPPAGAPGAARRPAAAVALPFWMGELALIRLPLLLFAFTLVLGSLLVVLSTWYLNSQSDAMIRAQQARNIAFDQFNHVENEKLEIRDYQPQFIALRDKGLLGEERRLEWVDAIRQIQERRKLLPISYEIDAQQAFKLEGQAALGAYRLRGSRMDLHMDLLHEMDLFDFLHDLRQRSYYTIQDCSIKRGAGAPNAAVAPSLAADCTLYWLTLGSAAPGSER